MYPADDGSLKLFALRCFAFGTPFHLVGRGLAIERLRRVLSWKRNAMETRITLQCSMWGDIFLHPPVTFSRQRWWVHLDWSPCGRSNSPHRRQAQGLKRSWLLSLSARLDPLAGLPPRSSGPLSLRVVIFSGRQNLRSPWPG